MARWRWLAGAAILAVVTGGSAAARTEVRFLPERGLDGVESGNSGRSRVDVEAQLASHIRQLADRRLPAGRDLSVTVELIDLAGVTSIGAGAHFGVRIVTDNTPPRIRLRWAVSERGRSIASGEETPTDAVFTWNPAPGVTGDSLGYEKELLTTWFGRRIASAAASRG